MYFNISKPPRFNPGIIPKILAKHYNIEADVTPLSSDIGQNFLVKANTNNPFIFKISNPSERLSMLEAQNAVLDFLDKKNLKFEIPRLIENTEKKKIVSLQDSKGNTFHARLFNFIRGQFLADIADPPKLLLEDIGAKVGMIDRSLHAFYHPGVYRYWHWDLKNIADLKKIIGDIKNPAKKRLVEYFLLQFETEVGPLFSSLRQSLIHNDLNDHNILIDPDSNKCVGLIDFGDMVYSCTIFDLAVALAYIMLQKNEPLETAVPVIKEYHKQYPLKKEEIEVLFYAICARLCLSVTMSAYQQQQQPDNEYLTISEKPAWDLLEILISTNPIKAADTFTEACGMKGSIKKTPPSSAILRDRKNLIGPSLVMRFQFVDSFSMVLEQTPVSRQYEIHIQIIDLIQTGQILRKGIVLIRPALDVGSDVDQNMVS